MNARLGCVIAALLVCMPIGLPAQAQTPDVARSYFVPEAGNVGTPIVGQAAVKFFRACPNNDGGASLPSNARIRIVLHDASDAPIFNLAPENIYIMFNGGTAVQGFSGAGADSIIANSINNTDPLCPDLRYMFADAATDMEGVTYITLAGAAPGAPGVTFRDSNRKWGHYDSDIPVYANGVLLQGRLTAAGGVNGDYVLRIKNFDVKGGLANGNNQGEVVSSVDYNMVKGGVAPAPYDYWLDFDSSGDVSTTDFNMFTAHMFHDCGRPLSP